MNGKGSLCIICIILLAITFFLTTYMQEAAAGCQNDEPYEDAQSHLIGLERWTEPSNNKVYYYVGNWEIPGCPDLVTDVNVAAATWSNIQFNGQTVKFRLSYAGRVSRSPEFEDGWNVLDWGYVPYSWVNAASYIYTYDSQPRRIKEIDTAFNYYKGWSTHAENNSGKFCVRNVAAHEFGHWVLLNDVGDSSDERSPAYLRYTMYYSQAPGEHVRESLECEDKWGVWYMYQYTSWPAPALLTTTAKLLPNYPDPFNPDTWFPYELNVDAQVTLGIYDVQGHLVRWLDLGYQKAGQYIDKQRAASWDGRNEMGQAVSSGSYFYQFQAGDFAANGKMVILK